MSLRKDIENIRDIALRNVYASQKASDIVGICDAALSAPGVTMAAKALPTQAEIDATIAELQAQAREVADPDFTDSDITAMLENKAASMLEALGKAVAETGEREPGWFLDGE